MATCAYMHMRQWRAWKVEGGVQVGQVVAVVAVTVETALVAARDGCDDFRSESNLKF